LYFLQELKPPDGLGKSKAKALKLKAVKYCLIDQNRPHSRPRRLYSTSIAVSMEVIIFGRPQLTRSSELDTTGPPYFLMSAGKLELASNARNSQGSNNSNPCL
jgi:hypothetical protein